LASLLSGALWTATATCASAQSAYDTGIYPGPQPGLGFVPYVDPGSPQAATFAAPFSAYPPVGWPQGATAWPQISPYEAPPVDQHRYHNGFWFNEQKVGGRRYYTMLSGTFNRFQKPDESTVGNPNAPQTFGTVAATGQAAGTAAPLFVSESWNRIQDPLTSGGFLGLIGVWNADDSGVQLHGFWADEGRSDHLQGKPGVNLADPTDLFRRAQDLIGNHAAIPLLDDQLPLTLLPIVPPNGTAVAVPGGAQPYDLFFNLRWQVYAYGAGITYHTNPFVESDSFKLRPNVGLRYLQVRENAEFHGADSGLGYVYNIGEDRPDPATIVGPLDILESQLRSHTKSHLAGPEIGVRMDFGNDKFLIWTNTKFGLMANHSERELYGYGILRVESQPNVVVPPLDQTVFSDDEVTTTVSPLFEQSVFVRSPILSYVPVVKNLKAFEMAQFHVGYTFLLVGEIYRPGDVIDWRGFPQFPSLTDEKSSWYMTSWSFGVEWMY
jgi:hypothetical protein